MLSSSNGGCMCSSLMVDCDGVCMVASLGCMLKSSLSKALKRSSKLLSSSSGIQSMAEGSSSSSLVFFLLFSSSVVVYRYSSRKEVSFQMAPRFVLKGMGLEGFTSRNVYAA